MLTSRTYEEKLVALIVDEAHTVNLWGDSFRQTFAEIGSLILIKVRVMALTATSTIETSGVRSSFYG